MKYLVMETFSSYAVLLDEDGRFVKSANPGYEVGQTVVNPVLMRDRPLEKKRGLSNKWMAGIVAVAAMVALFFGINFYQNNFIPHSSILMAINPEAEMVLNRNGEVLEVTGTNEEGRSLVEDFETDSTEKTVVANELVDRAIEMGFLAEGGRVAIGIDTPDQVLFDEYGVELRRALDDRISIVIEITNVEEMNRQEKPEAEPEPETEPEPTPEPDPEPEPEPEEPTIPTYISADEAKQNALNPAGFSEPNADIEKVEFDTDDGIPYYEVEFEVGDDDYEYEIHAISGTILDYDQDIEDNDDD